MVNKFRSQIGEASSISNITQPKFGKIIFSPHELCRLRIPEGFASRYCKNMLNPVYLEVPGGEVWEVEVEHSEGHIWLAQGWKDFSDYYSISRGHFLIFGYNARSHFNVTIFDLSATEIEYPTAEIESDDSTDISDVEISEGYKEHEQQSDIVTSESESEADRDQEIAENHQRAKAFKSKNPFIISFMHTSYVSRPYGLNIPLKFAMKYLMQSSGNLVLRVPGRGSWSVKCIMLRKEAKFTCGWKAFVLDNKLKYGDVCVLEVINDTKLSLIDVTIFPGVSDSTN